MPLYEYRCNDCRKGFTVLVGVTAEADSGLCPNCGSNRSTRRVSRFGRLRGDDDVLDELADPDRLGDPDDPSTMRRWANEVGDVMGEDLGADFDEYLDSAAADE